MSVLHINNIAQSYGPHDIFTGLSARIPHGGKVGLIGANGVGKSSLLRIIAGVETPAAGSVHTAGETRIGYLPQEAGFEGRTHSLYNEVRSALAPVDALAEQMRQMEAQMAAGDSSEGLLARYGETLSRFEAASGYAIDARIERTLSGLGLTAWDTPLEHLSGGQRTRTLLARLLVTEPDLLVLDEPTNHLDIEALGWLESTLQAWSGAMLIVSHDRAFLDRVVTHIWEMARGYIDEYRGNYSAYLQQRDERWAYHQKVFEQEREKIEKEMEIIKRYWEWGKITEAQGRLRRLSRLLVAIEQVGFMAAVTSDSWLRLGIGKVRMLGKEEAERRVKALRSPVVKPLEMRLRPPDAPRSGDLVVRTADLEVGYPGTPLFTTPDLTLCRGEVAAVVGPNGSGKTTLLHTLLGEVEPLAGSVKLGASLDVAVFSQTHSELVDDNTVLEELRRHHSIPTAEARHTLARFLFRGDDVFKQVGALSGGERARLSLAILVLSDANLLLLDEPTNHLDIPAQEALEAMLADYGGTVLMVSHDRYLIERLATQVWTIHEGRLHIGLAIYAPDPPAEQPRSTVSTPPEAVKPRPARDEKRLSAVEDAIEKAEYDLAVLEEAISAAAGDAVEVSRLSHAYADTAQRLDGLLMEWEHIASAY